MTGFQLRSEPCCGRLGRRDGALGSYRPCCLARVKEVRWMAPRLKLRRSHEKDPSKSHLQTSIQGDPYKVKTPNYSLSRSSQPTSQILKLPRAVRSTPFAFDKKNRSDNPHSDTRQAQVITMLRAPAGATVDAIAAAVEWQSIWSATFLLPLSARSSVSTSFPNKAIWLNLSHQK